MLWWIRGVFKCICVLCLQKVNHIFRGNSVEILLKRIILINFIIFSGIATQGKKGTRKATKMTNLTNISHRRRMPIKFDEFGNPIGEGDAQFASYIGMLIQTILCVF